MTRNRRSLRRGLSLRFTATMGVAVALISIVTLIVQRETLDRELNGNILSVAAIQAASLTDSPDGEMHFHEWNLTVEEAASVRDINRYAQVLDTHGRVLLRSQFLAADLPLSTDGLDRALAGGIFWVEQLHEERPVRSVYYPLERLGPTHNAHVLQVAAPLEARNQALRRSGTALLSVNLLVVLGSLIGSWWLGGTVVRPLDTIIDHAEAVKAGADFRIAAYAEYEEYHRLVTTLNTMLDRLHRAFDSQRRFTADASHELRTPLTVLRGELELALRRPRGNNEYLAILRSSLDEVLRLSTITEELLLLARADAGRSTLTLELTAVRQVTDRVGERLGDQAAAKHIDLGFLNRGSTAAVLDPVLVEQAVFNLLENALKFTPRGGRVRVSTVGDLESVRVRVEDSGPGLGPEPGLLFERFFQDDQSRSSSELRRGAGLGLSIVLAIVEAHGGRVRAVESSLGGAGLELVFPRG